MQGLGIGIRDDFGHAFDIAPGCLEKPSEVAEGLRIYVPGPEAKKGRIFPAERQKSPVHSLQGRWVMAFLFPTTSLSGVACGHDSSSLSIPRHYA